MIKVCRQIGDHGPKRRSSAPHWCKVPPRPNSHFSVDTQARWVRNGSKRTPGYKMKSNGFARSDEARTRKALSTRSVPHLRTGPGAPGFYTMVEGANTRAGIRRQGLCQQGQLGHLRGCHRDGIMRTAARHRSRAIDPCEPGNNAGVGRFPNAAFGLRTALPR